VCDNLYGSDYVFGMRQGLDFTDTVHFEQMELGGGGGCIITYSKKKIIREIVNVMASCCKCLKARLQASGYWATRTGATLEAEPNSRNSCGRSFRFQLLMYHKNTI
jgi:hypothetical protein